MLRLETAGAPRFGGRYILNTGSKSREGIHLVSGNVYVWRGIRMKQQWCLLRCFMCVKETSAQRYTITNKLLTPGMMDLWIQAVYASHKRNVFFPRPIQSCSCTS